MKQTSILLSCFNGTELIESYIDHLLSENIDSVCTLIAVNFPFSHSDPLFVEQQLKRFPDLILINKDENVSLYEAWNIAINNAKTKFVSNLNLDDRVTCNYYKLANKFMDAYEADVFSSAAYMTSEIGCESKDKRLQKPFDDGRYDSNGIAEYGISDLINIRETKLLKNNPPHCAPVWRKSLNDEIGQFDSEQFDFAADFEFWLKCAIASKKMITYKEPLTLFYAGANTASDRLQHKENQSILDYWQCTFPPHNYRETHLGRKHDLLHYCMNLNIIFSNQKYVNHLYKWFVSVVILTHRYDEMFEQCLQSVRSQSYPWLDIIVVLDNDSNGSIRDKTEKFIGDDKRFTVISLNQKHERNFGRNVGITVAKGEWTVLVDGDDWLPRDSVSNRVRYAEKTTDIVFGGLFIEGDNGQRTEAKFPSEFTYKDMRRGWPHHCSLILKTELLKSIFYPSSSHDLVNKPSEIAGEDVWLMLQLLKRNRDKKFINCGELVYHYRRYASSSYTDRHISIKKVIDIIQDEFGLPEAYDKEYASDLAPRVIAYLFWKYLNNSRDESKTFTDNNSDFRLFGSLVGSLDPKQIESVLANLINDAKLLDSSFVERAKAVSGSIINLRNRVVSTRLNYKSDFSRLYRWKNRHKGQKCILMCNGPSLNKVDFARVDTEKYVFFGLNKIFLGFENLGIKPKYIACVNKKVLEQSSAMYNDLMVTKFISNRVEASLIPENPFTFHMNTVNLPKPNNRFNKNIIEYVHEGWTVTHAALQIIHYMGFDEVNIIGMDHNFKQHKDGLENQSSVIEGDDIDHFHPDYFGNGKEWDFPDLKNSEISYAAARKAFEEDGKKIFDCTIGGKCTIFDKVDIEHHLYR